MALRVRHFAVVRSLEMMPQPFAAEMKQRLFRATARLRGAPSRRGATLLAAVLMSAPACAAASEFRLVCSTWPAARSVAGPDGLGEAGSGLIDLESRYPWKLEGQGFHLALETAGDAGDPQETAASAPPSSSAPAPKKKLFTTGTTLVTLGALALGALDGLNGPLYYGFQSLHFVDEGWFGMDTYAGGADKVSHFVASSGAARALFEIYKIQGHSEDQSFALAFATTAMVGFLTEVGDGVTIYGFSAQDLTADLVGTAAGLLVDRNHLQDLFGVRLGKVPTIIPPAVTEGHVASFGTSYSNEIYAVDLQFGGLFKRLDAQPGIARYFLSSFVFYTKGFGYDPPLPGRYQEIGFELGLNFPEILKAVGVKETTWWGGALLAVFNFFRIPFTQVGVYYDLTSHKWYGPGAPYNFH